MGAVHGKEAGWLCCGKQCARQLEWCYLIQKSGLAIAREVMMPGVSQTKDQPEQLRVAAGIAEGLAIAPLDGVAPVTSILCQCKVSSQRELLQIPICTDEPFTADMALNGISTHLKKPTLAVPACILAEKRNARVASSLPRMPSWGSCGTLTCKRASIHPGKGLGLANRQ
jgi:hypothetical protein